MYPKLCKRLSEQNITYTDLANLLNLPETEICLKFQGILEWEMVEVVKICKLLRTSDAELLFCTV